MPARLRFLATYLLFWLVFFLVLRTAFLIATPGQALALPVTTLLGSFAYGLRLDLAAAAYLSVIPFLLVSLSTLPSFTRWSGRLLLGYTALAVPVLALLAAADIGVFRGWGHRIEASVLGYLTHPREVWASAGAGPREALVALWLGLSVLGLALATRLFSRRLRCFAPSGKAALAGLSGCALLLLVPARGGFQLIPINQSAAYFSTSRFANQAALNVGWNFFDSWRRGLSRRSNPYAVMLQDSARALVDRARGHPERSEGSQAGDPSVAPLPQDDPGVLRTRRPSILLIVWESLPARAMERLGGVSGVTPELHALAETGLLFRRFYAAGDRTEKGLAALLSGALTIPNASILRVPSKAASLPMLTRDLAEAGYHTSFYYGGELGFGNLRSFTVEGRVEQVLGKPEFPRASWSSKWGAHDEAVAERLLEDLRRMRRPFLSTWLTLSSHEPFEVPGPVRVRGQDAEARFLNSLAYTDHVVGHLLRRAAREPWWATTLVIIVGDHSKPLERTDASAPFKSAESWYQVPMLWTGGALAASGEVDVLGSQTDLAPTLLSLLRLPGGARYQFGRDLFAAAGERFAFYGFDEGFGLVTERGSLVWERAAGRITSSSGSPSTFDLELGRALLQLAYQDYLNR